MQPHEIEQESFAIIDAEAGAHRFSPDQWAVVRRMIHTSADFDYVADVRIHPRAVAAGVNAIRSGATIFTDTNMARTGIRQKDLAHFGAAARCLMADAAVARKAAEQGVTRARAAVQAVAHQLEGCIYVVGNAPTALLHLVELIRDRKARPALVIGLPVGFVNAAESKAKLLDLDIPYITNVGRKGGSNVAAGAVNALILLAGRDG
jgi:precorrin-8X/cobalt-precorrin-8 methylmutase